MSVVEFLLARIAEDARAADLVLRPYGEHAASNEAEWWSDEREWFKCGFSSDETPLVMRMTPQRVLAECEAKRRIVEALADMKSVEAERREQVVTLRWACQHLALPYADHPDYRPEWRP